MRRYSVTCHACRGTGYHTSSDKDDYPTLEDCGRCYRGVLTFALTREDEIKLRDALTKSLTGDVES